MPDPGATAPKPTLDYATPAPPPAPAPAVPRYRKILAGFLFVAGVLLAAYAPFLHHGAARANVGTAALGFVVYGLVIRFGHVRLE